MTESAPMPTLKLEAGDPNDSTRITGHIEISISGKPLAMDLTVPDGPVAYETLLPILHQVTDVIVEDGVADMAAAGRKISCAAGCGACCRQMVPLAESEIRAIVRLVDAMPEPRRSIVRARFDDAMRRLQASKVVDLLNRGDRKPADTIEMIFDYFRLGIACPFLENESCSIYFDRPMVCREYLVTSPPSECAILESTKIERVPMAGSVNIALLRAAKGTDETTAWIPMIAAFHFTALCPEVPPKRTAPQQLAAIFEGLRDNSAPIMAPELPETPAA